MSQAIIIQQRQWALALDDGTKGFLGFGYKTKNQNHKVYRVSRIFSLSSNFNTWL